MSGHSKWSKIKRQKGAADHKRGQVFTKLGREITIAAQHGGGDPDMNFKLRVAINKARSANMPKDNIERAIKRGTGEDDSGTYEELVYEGFGPDNGAVVIEVLTDNKNRTVSQLKHILSKRGNGLASNGTVMWQFDHRGIITLEDKELSEELEMQLLDSGALDYEKDEDGVTLITAAEDLDKVRTALEQAGRIAQTAELAYIAKETIPASDPQSWDKFMDELEELDDVSTVYTNISTDE